MPEWRDPIFAELDRLIAVDQERDFRERVKHAPLRGFRAHYGDLTDRQRALIGRGIPATFFQPSGKPHKTLARKATP